MTLTAVSELSQAKAISGGYGHSLAISSSGALYAWGVNDNYQLGNGTNVYSSSPIQVGSETNWVDVACGDYHSLALNSSGEVYAWGRNSEQQCGINGGGQISTPTKITFPEVVSINKISACSNYSLFADTINSRKVYGCGKNSHYLMSSTGLNNLISTPTQISDFNNATIIATGPELCGAVVNNSIVVRGVYDFTYNGTTSDQYTPSAFASVATVPDSSGATNYLDLCIGNKFLLAIKEDRSIWGYTFEDLPSWLNGQNPENSSLGIYGVRTVFSGSAYHPQNNILALINDSIKAIKIKCGREHVLILDENNKLYSWGGNEFGQLGRETIGSNDTNIIEITGYSGTWANIGCGNYHSLTILNS